MSEEVARIHRRIVRIVRNAAVEIFAGGLPCRDFNARLARPPEFRRIRVLVNSDILDGPGGGVQFVDLDSVNDERHSFRSQSSRREKIAQEGHNVLAFRWKLPNELIIDFHCVRIIFGPDTVLSSHHSNLLFLGSNFHFDGDF